MSIVGGRAREVMVGSRNGNEEMVLRVFAECQRPS